MKKTAISLSKKLMVLGVIIVLVALTACGGGTTPPASSPAASKPASPAASSAAASPKPTGKVVVVVPDVTGPPIIPSGRLIALPKDGATWPSNTIQVTLDYKNFNIVKSSSTNKAGNGHFILYDNVDTLPTAKGENASVVPTGSKGKIITIGDTSDAFQIQGFIWRNIPNGPHKIGAQLVNNDNTPLEPPVFDIVSITVDGPFPQGTPTASIQIVKKQIAAPKIASFTPTSGGAGTKVTITGTQFDSVVVKVEFGGEDAIFTVDSATQITATVGSGATGKVTVTSASGVATSNDTFTFK